jgi:hypothetical protein
MESLPNEILCYIQDFLPFKDLLTCQITAPIFNSYREEELSKGKRLEYIRMRQDNYPIPSDENIATILTNAHIMSLSKKKLGTKYCNNKDTILSTRIKFMEEIKFDLESRMHQIQEQLQLTYTYLSERYKLPCTNFYFRKCMKQLFGINDQIKDNIFIRNKINSRSAFGLTQTTPNKLVQSILELNLAETEHEFVKGHNMLFKPMCEEIFKSIQYFSVLPVVDKVQIRTLGSIHSQLARLHEEYTAHRKYYDNSKNAIINHCERYEIYWDKE